MMRGWDFLNFHVNKCHDSLHGQRNPRSPPKLRPIARLRVCGVLLVWQFYWVLLMSSPIAQVAGEVEGEEPSAGAPPDLAAGAAFLDNLLLNLCKVRACPAYSWIFCREGAPHPAAYLSAAL